MEFLEMTRMELGEKFNHSECRSMMVENDYPKFQNTN
jgi:hypothetical protein